ncbi:MAG: hypothetical protein D6830_03850 [Ignavibacteria bacterium]|nr:MAG: hypothetical protein D6830_03850 [Ignavibacteria bacterium]
MRKLKSNIVYFILLFAFQLNAQSMELSEKALEGTKVFDITSDSKYIWFATNGDGIIKLNKKTGRWDSYNDENSNLTNSFFHSIAADKKYVYAGSSDGLFILDKRRNKWIKRKFGKGGQLSNWIRAIKYDEKSNAVWIGRFKYLTKFDIRRKRFKDFDLTQKGNLKTNTIKTIELENNKYVWFGTEGGLLRYDKSRDLDDEFAVTYFDNSYNYFLGQGEMISISDILFEQGFIWIGTDELITEDNPDFNLGGLFRFDRKNEWIRLDTKDGLPGNGIFSIELVGKYLWVSTYQFDRKNREKYGRGLTIIDREDLSIKPILNSSIPQNIYKIYNDGDNVWLGTDNGVVKIKLENEFVKNFEEIND